MLDRATVDHFAELAKITLTEAEREAMRTQLSRIRDEVAVVSLGPATVLGLAAETAAGQVHMPPIMG
jgi:Asp-tRNA(Asn)/Glu-tRNA(Gln) amidotransferase C subunit